MNAELARSDGYLDNRGIGCERHFDAWHASYFSEVGGSELSHAVRSVYLDTLDDGNVDDDILEEEIVFDHGDLKGFLSSYCKEQPFTNLPYGFQQRLKHTYGYYCSYQSCWETPGHFQDSIDADTGLYVHDSTGTYYLKWEKEQKTAVNLETGMVGCFNDHTMAILLSLRHSNDLYVSSQRKYMMEMLEDEIDASEIQNGVVEIHGHAGFLEFPDQENDWTLSTRSAFSDVLETIRNKDPFSLLAA